MYSNSNSYHSTIDRWVRFLFSAILTYSRLNCCLTKPIYTRKSTVDSDLLIYITKMLRLRKISCVTFGGWVAGLTTERFLRLKSVENLSNQNPPTESIFRWFKCYKFHTLHIFGAITAVYLYKYIIYHCW